jgi:two-component system, NtrC family, nitrogen regulation response regulator GlnG
VTDNNNTLPILLVDDEVQILRSTSLTLRTAGFAEVATLSDSREVLGFIKATPVAAALIDLNMPNMNGEILLASIKEHHPEVPVIILTAANEIELAVRCMRAGATDYLVKPVEKTRLISAVNRALETRELQQEISNLRASLLSRSIKNLDAFKHIVTDNESMASLFCYVEAISRTPQPVLITGETGTGKELFARAIHKASGRKGAFVAVTVSGLDDATFSDTLFGHKKGAFTGAEQKREGLIASAQNGTLFLDEIGDLSPQSQVKLLRMLQEREYYPLGDDQPKISNARIIVATNIDLNDALERGHFRQDLFYRLRPHHVHIPPLRDRIDDVPGLVELFAEKASAELGLPPPNIPAALYQLLQTYHFPGNVRELEGMVFDAVARLKSSTLSLHSFRQAMGIQQTIDPPIPTEVPTVGFEQRHPLPTLKQAEDALIREALHRAGDNQGIAANLLGITRQALNKRLLRARE